MNKTNAAILIAVLAVLFSVMPPGTSSADDYRPKVRQWETAAPGANTDALAADLTWKSSKTLRLTIQCATSTVVNLMVTRGATENALGMGSSVAVVAGALYTWDVDGLQPGDSIQVQVETDSVLDQLAIGEVTK